MTNIHPSHQNHNIGILNDEFDMVHKYCVDCRVLAYVPGDPTRTGEKGAVYDFADVMADKLTKRKKKYKEFGWRDPEYKTVRELESHLFQEYVEYLNSERDTEELVDVANLAFMLWDRLRRDRED
jgi:hypothetical protein